jgi:hypothetical protein
MENVRAKSSVLDCELNSFDETGSIMGVIRPVMVVTCYGLDKLWKWNVVCFGVIYV